MTEVEMKLSLLHIALEINISLNAIASDLYLFGYSNNPNSVSIFFARP